LFAAGLASKPMVITLPFVLLLLDYWPLGRVRGAKMEVGEIHPTFSWSRLAIEKLPLLALSAASAVITMRAQQAGGAIRTSSEVSLGARLATAIWAYAMYLWKMLWPARLAPLYPHPGDSLATWQVLVAAAALISVSAIVWRFRACRYLLVGWLWFLGTLVPVIGLVQVGEAAMADRYAYIPLIGIFVMIAFGIAHWAEGNKLRVWPAIAAAASLIALALVTLRQIGYWQSNTDLWSHTLAVTENNFVAENNLGGALILESKEEEAHPHFEAAARINPRDPMSRSNLGIYLQHHNQMRAAIAEYEAAIELTSDPGLLAQTYANLGAAQRALGEDDSAQNNFEQSVRLNPTQFNAWRGLGLLAQKQGKLDEAITDLSRSVELRPTAPGYFELGHALEQGGRMTEALDAYEQALRVSPDYVEAQQAAAALRQQKK
jgi:protein O-mannosyl-transferase